jgi:dTDP-4-dehydrorhamnose reductase
MSCGRNKTRILLIGRGILGSAVADHFTRLGYHLTVMTDRYGAENDSDYFQKVRRIDADWVINAIGRIPMRKAPVEELRRVNVDFPLHLKAMLLPRQNMIHMSSDAVFGGSKSCYTWKDSPDPIDEYGRSKRDAEACAESGRCWVIRSSLIGMEEKTSAGLMGWYWRQQEKASGYVNHLWNGNTSLELAKVFDELIQGKIPNTEPILQVGYLPSISKCQLLEFIHEISGRGPKVIPTEAPLALNRTLIPNVVRPPIQEQLREFFNTKFNS